MSVKCIRGQRECDGCMRCYTRRYKLNSKDEDLSYEARETLEIIEREGY